MSFSSETNPTQSHSPDSAVRYRALCPWAVASVAVGGLSVLPIFFSDTSSGASYGYIAIIPLVGIFLGWRARLQIQKAPDEWTGLRLAHFGMGLSLALWVAGCGWLIFSDVRSVPFGYQLVEYETLQPDPNVPTEPIPQTALNMQDKKVFIRGFMQAGRQQAGIKEFILCPTSGDCPFCTPDPNPTEMIRVTLQGDLETSFTTNMVGVAGRFRVDPDDPSKIPYGLDADEIR